MKVKVIKVFRDKETKERYKVGQVIDLPKERAEDVDKRGLAKLIKTEKKEGKPKTSKKEIPAPPETRTIKGTSKKEKK